MFNKKLFLLLMLLSLYVEGHASEIEEETLGIVKTVIKPPTTLDILPERMWGHISYYLQTQDLKSVKLTCKNLCSVRRKAKLRQSMNTIFNTVPQIMNSNIEKNVWEKWLSFF